MKTYSIVQKSSITSHFEILSKNKQTNNIIWFHVFSHSHRQEFLGFVLAEEFCAAP